MVVMTRMTSPHQLPSISHPSERHTRRISTKLTSGNNMPIDFKASIIHSAQSAFTVDQIVDRPRTATSAASAAAWDALNLTSPVVRRGLTSAATGRVDIRISLGSSDAHRELEELLSGQPLGEFLTLTNYLDELRRALMRARADTKNALAEPTTARIAVGFSGEFTQPSCP